MNAVASQCPAPSHCVPPFWLQAVPAADGGFDGTPAVHTLSVHWLASTGTSVLSTTLDWPPKPSHWFW